MAMLFRALFCCTFLCMLGMPIEGAIQNFSVSFDSLSPVRTGKVAQYGSDVVLYPAYPPDVNVHGLIFIPSSSNTSYILSLFVSPSVVWMANRNNPVSGNFSLTLNQSSGNLVLLDGDGSLAWSSNLSSRPETGLVSMEVIADYDNSSMPLPTVRLSDVNNATLWQSSDHPTHALVTNQYLRPGKRLISWASPSDPSEGLYAVVMEVGGVAFYYNASLPYLAYSLNGPNDVQDLMFDLAHTCSNLSMAFMHPAGTLQLLQSNEIAKPDLTLPWDPCATSAWVQINGGSGSSGEVLALSLQYDGSVVVYRLNGDSEPVFDPFSQSRCLLPNYCGPYGVCKGPLNCECPENSDGSFPSTFTSNRSHGCPPTQKLTCQSPQYFLRLSGVDYFSNDYSSTLNFSTQETCKDACLQNCSCLAAFWRVHTKSCFHVDHMTSLRGDFNSSYLAFLKVENVSQPKQRPSVSPSSAPPTRLIVGVVSGVVGLLVLCMSAAFIYRKLRTDPELEEEDPFWNSVPGLPTRYSYKDLHSITNGFTETLGKGGFGTVYAGVLQDGARVAVKRLESLRQGKKEFRAEIVILGGIRHYNLVGLIGFCAQGSHRLLVYEYMAKGSLDEWISTGATPPLNWEYRFKIALGAARGLAYLHRDCKDKIIHLDIKPQNILLDEDFVAKVSDFGLSTLMGRDETHVMTSMRGTPGYFAPEWLTEGSISEKCDVFSFGKLLLEILGGRRNLDPSVADSQKLYFPSWLYHQVAQGGETELPQIAKVETQEEARQARLLMNTAFLCVLENPDQRPSMERVVTMLEGHNPALEHLQLSDLFQGLRWALSMPAPSLAQSRIDEALGPIYQSASSS